MGHLRLGLTTLTCVVALTACGALDSPNKKKIDPVNVVDATDLNDIMLTVADPNEAVAYFQTSLSKEPDRDLALYLSDRLKDKGFLVSYTGKYENVLKIRPPLADGMSSGSRKSLVCAMSSE